MNSTNKLLVSRVPPNLEETDIICPYCGETITILVDSSSGSQEYYEDCFVCCAPILFSIVINPEGRLVSVDVKRDDEI